jgi:hypothetical protein
MFERYLASNSDPAIRDLSSLIDLTRNTLLDYREWVFCHYSNDAARKGYKSLAASLRTLQGKSSSVPGVVRAELEIPFRSLGRRDTDGAATGPYTIDEQAELEAACKKAINSTLERLREGKRLLNQGEDPRENGTFFTPTQRFTTFSTGWEITPNILWYIVHVLKGRMPSASSADGRAEPLLRFLHNGGKATRRPISKTEAYDFLFPNTKDITPFILLLTLKTGLNAESVLTLERDCLQGSEGGMTSVEYKKSRGSHERLARRFSHRGANSPVGIIKTVLQLTQDLVPLAAPNAQNNLWLSHQLIKGEEGNTGNKFSNKADTLDVRHLSLLVNGSLPTKRMRARPGFLEKYDVRGRDGEILRFTFRAARKTEATNQYLRLGSLANVSRRTLKHHGKQAVDTTAIHYLANDATVHVHDAAVRRAQDKTVAGARRIVITSAQPSALEIKDLAEELAVTERKVVAILQGEQDLFIASCKDFYNKPNGRPNTPCDEVWKCFECANGLWTTRILPRLIKFLWFIEDQKLLLSAEDWIFKFSVPYAAIMKDILPRFQTRIVEWAKAEARELPFYVPPNIKDM